jgi:carbonic anhydrase
MEHLAKLFEQNRAWAARHTSRDPEFFKRLCDIQTPEHVWIGCADSRVPANQIVGMSPGQLFVHRNVANIVRSDDSNCMAVVSYAVEVLRVKHLIVTGHYGCGGVRAVLDGTATGVVASWLEPLRQVLAREEEKPDWARLCEINVVAQVKALAASEPVRKAWASGQELTLHGWIYDLHDGLLKDLRVTTSGS